MTGPYVVLWCSLPLRKAMAQDHAGILRFAPAPLEAQRFDDEEDARAAILATQVDAGHQLADYQVLPLAVWEDEQEARTKRRPAKKKAAPGDAEVEA